MCTLVSPNTRAHTHTQTHTHTDTCTHAHALICIHEPTNTLKAATPADVGAVIASYIVFTYTIRPLPVTCPCSGPDSRDMVCVCQHKGKTIHTHTLTNTLKERERKRARRERE